MIKIKVEMTGDSWPEGLSPKSFEALYSQELADKKIEEKIPELKDVIRLAFVNELNRYFPERFGRSLNEIATVLTDRALLIISSCRESNAGFYVLRRNDVFNIIDEVLDSEEKNRFHARYLKDKINELINKKKV